MSSRWRLSSDDLPAATTLPPVVRVGRRWNSEADAAGEPTGLRRTTGEGSAALTGLCVYDVVSMEASLLFLSLAASCDED
jgi:hypothetical protein